MVQYDNQLSVNIIPVLNVLADWALLRPRARFTPGCHGIKKRTKRQGGS